MQNTIHYDIKINNLTGAVDNIKEYLAGNKASEISIDLSGLNIFDAARISLLSSAYYYGKHPDGKITCRCNSDTVKELLADIATPNLEIV